MLQQFKTSLAAAHTAAAAADYQTALMHARAARIAVLGIPKTEFDRERIEFRWEDLDLMIKDLEKAAASQSNANALIDGQRGPGGPFQQMQYVYR